MTLWELVQYSRGAAEAAFDPVSLLCAIVANCHASKRKKFKPADFHPYEIMKKRAKRPATDEELMRFLGRLKKG